MASFSLLYYIKDWFLPRDDYRKNLLEITMICTFGAIEMWLSEPPISKVLVKRKNDEKPRQKKIVRKPSRKARVRKAVRERGAAPEQV